jgi:hypothetical protein
MVDLETMIVLIIERGGKTQKFRFEKKSGNALYDQSAIRAIKKQNPYLLFLKNLVKRPLRLESVFFQD